MGVFYGGGRGGWGKADEVWIASKLASYGRAEGRKRTRKEKENENEKEKEVRG